MDVNGKSVVITGGARGIGAAMARRFADAGANIVIADLDQSEAEMTAAAIGGLGVKCDVTLEGDIEALVQVTEDEFGKVDMFCSNAGAVIPEPDHGASASNEAWALNWDLHVMSHVYAARAVLPKMIERQEGYLLQMASAAGLLGQIGNSAYSATKYACIGLAEALAVSHRDDGIRVSVICPKYVATPLLGYEGAEGATEDSSIITPQAVANAVYQGVTDERFLIFTHKDTGSLVEKKYQNFDNWIDKMSALRRNILSEIGTTDITALHKKI